MFKIDFWFVYEGKPRSPKYHVCECKTIKEWRDEYRFANSTPVRIVSRNDGKEKEVDEMGLCGYCKNVLLEQNPKLEPFGSLDDFVNILKKSGDVKVTSEIDIFGYVKNWEEISNAFREKKNFTCERCGTHVEDYDHGFMQTHHKNGDKTDNRAVNLECLCIKCHSEVDENHKKNFSRGANPTMIREYMQKYHKPNDEESQEGTIEEAGTGMYGK